MPTSPRITGVEGTRREPSARAERATPERRTDAPTRAGPGNRSLHRALAGDDEPFGGARMQRAAGLGNRAIAARATGRSTMTIEAAGGPLEREADRVADEVGAAIDGAPAPRTPKISAARPTAALAAEGPSHGPEGGAVDPAVERQIQAAAGGGEALADGVRGPLERGFGVDLGALRIHTGARADSLSRSLHARAFTVGRDLFFRRGAYAPASAGGRRLLAHEVTHAIQQGATGSAGGGARVQRSLTIQRDYAGLDDLDRARVDAQAEAKYAEKSEEYEYKLGLRLMTSTEASSITDELLRRVRKIVDAWAKATGQKRKATYAREFAFEEGDKYYGAFEMTGDAISEVFGSLDKFGSHQPLRKRLKVIYNAVRNNNLAKWLKVAADNLEEEDRVTAARLAGDTATQPRSAISVRKTTPVRRPDGGLDLAGAATDVVAPTFARRSGLRDILRGDVGLRARVTQASTAEKRDVTHKPGTPEQFTAPTHVAAPDMWSGLARGTPAEAAQIDVANRDRLYSQNKGVDWQDQYTLEVGDLPDLTAREIQLLRRRKGLGGGKVTKRMKTAFKGRRADKIEWEQGREAIAVMLNSPVERAAAAIGARLEAGVSGSTGMMYAASKNLGVSDLASLKKLRLAMLGWMLPNHDHSFYEIMRAAEIQGVPFVVDPAFPGFHYEAPANFDPISVASLRDVLPEHRFPRHWLSTAYKDELAATIERAREDEVSTGVESDDTVAKYRLKVEALGITRAVAQALGERPLVELIALHGDLRRAGLQDEAVGDDTARQRAKAANLLRLRHVRERAAYRFLAHTEPTRAELWLGQMLIREGLPPLMDHRLLQGVDEARLPALGADAAARRTIVEGAGVPAAALAGLQDHVIDDLVVFSAMIRGLPIDPAKSVVDPANNPEFGKIFRTQSWVRLAQLVPSQILWMIVTRIFRHVHGAHVAGSIWAQGLERPELKAAIDLGVPENLAMKMDIKAVVDVTGALAGEIDTILTHDADVRITELKALRAAFSGLAGYIDGNFGLNRFDMIVAAIAEKKGIDVSGDTHLGTLARLASVLLRSSTITTPDQATTGFGNFTLETAKQTAVDNLRTEGRTFDDSEFAGITPVELAAINAYTKLGGMGAWQTAVGAPVTKKSKAFDAPVRLIPQIQAAVAGLRKLPVFAGPLYNAQRSDLTGKPEDAKRAFPVGSVHDHNNFLSAAKTVEASFIPKAGYGVAWVIEHVRSGRDISYLSTNFLEREVLFPPGSRFIVTRVEDRSTAADGYGKVWVYVDEL